MNFSLIFFLFVATINAAPVNLGIPKDTLLTSNVSATTTTTTGHPLNQPSKISPVGFDRETYRYNYRANENQNDYESSILCSFAPVLALIVVCLVLLAVSRYGYPMFSTMFPIHISSVPFAFSAYLYCRGRVTENVCLLQFMRNFVEPIPSPQEECQCWACDDCGKKVVVRVPPTPSAGVIAFPSVSFKKESELVNIDWTEKKEVTKKVAIPDSETDSSSESNNESEENESGISSREDTVSDSSNESNDESEEEDSPMVININPFDPEYVYAALAPDIQHPSYNFIEERMAEQKAAKSAKRLPESTKKSKKRRVRFRRASSLETVCE